MISRFDEHFTALPIMAILRGIAPEEVEGVAGILLDEGIRVIEIPLGSPRALDAIARLAAFAGKSASVGAGTVTRPDEVRQVIEAGGELVVSPHCDPAIVQACVESSALPIPGFRTATEAFRAVQAGARVLKFFPSSVRNASEIGALKAVLPPEARVLAVGGVTALNADTFRECGADGIGVATSIFSPGKDLVVLRSDTRRIVESWGQGGGR